MECIDDPRDSCDLNNGGADCGQICVKKTGAGNPPGDAPTDQPCAGPDKLPCTEGYECVKNPKPTDCTPADDLNVCPGLCQKKQSQEGGQACAGPDKIPCTAGFQCVENTDAATCTPSNDLNACPGICKPERQCDDDKFPEPCHEDERCVHPGAISCMATTGCGGVCRTFCGGNANPPPVCKGEGKWEQCVAATDKGDIADLPGMCWPAGLDPPKPPGGETGAMGRRRVRF